MSKIASKLERKTYMTIKPQRLAQTQINSVITLYSNGKIQRVMDSVETLTKYLKLYKIDKLNKNNHEEIPNIFC